jgi:DNA-binding transcriptional ArsR family regulator
MTTEARRDVFQAIADPTRRQIIELVAHNEMNLNSIANNFDISRPSISQHIKILYECGIIDIQKIGRERYCKIQPTNLREVADWVGRFRGLWEPRLDSFEKYLNKLQSKRKKNEKGKRRKKPNTNTKKNL